VHRGDVDGVALCRMFNKAISKMGTPKYLSTDHDPLFVFHRWQANLRILDVEEIKTVPYVPLSHPFIERLIGTVRREFLDHTLFWNVFDMERKLEDFKQYYNHYQVHSSLNGYTPAETSDEAPFSKADLNGYQWQTHCRGLFQPPLAA
jgi:transposase InsO family protein